MTTSRAALLVLSLALLLWLGLQSVAGQTGPASWYVATTGDDANDCQSWATACQHIQAAIDKAGRSDTIRIGPGTYFENIYLTKGLDIRGAGVGRTIIDGDYKGTVIKIEHLRFDYMVTIAHLTIQHGASYGDGAGAGRGYGAGVTIDDSNLILDSVFITENYLLQSYGAGGVFSRGIFTIMNSTISFNTAHRGAGGVNSDASYSHLTITDSQITHNKLIVVDDVDYPYQASGVASTGGDEEYNLIITNSTISHNESPRGGAVASYGGIKLVNNTFTENVGGGLFIFGDWSYEGSPDGHWMSISNTIFNDAPACGRLSGLPSFLSTGHNIDVGDTCGFRATGDITNTNPLLQQLSDNGGPTWTHGLHPGSPAFDAGSCVESVDQRGAPRPAGQGCDIGAVEFDSQAPTRTPSPTPTPTETPLPTSTPTETATPEATQTDMPTTTPTSLPTETSIPTKTSTPGPSVTSTPVYTIVPDEPGNTPIYTVVHGGPWNTPTPTRTPTRTRTPTATRTITLTSTATPTSTPTATPTATATASPSPTPVPVRFYTYLPWIRSWSYDDNWPWPDRGGV